MFHIVPLGNNLTFVSDSIWKKGEGFIAFGTFAMHGVSKQIQLPFNVVGKDAEGSVGITSRYVLKRSDYLIGKDASSDNYVSNEIMVEIDFIAKKPKAPSK